MTDADSLKLANVFARILAVYSLTRNELRLGVLLLERTFLRGQASAQIKFVDIARELGGRSNEWYAYFERLHSLGLVHWNQAEGVVRLVTDLGALSRERALRTARPMPDESGPLPLDGERLLDDALSQISQTAALAVEQPSEPETTPFDSRSFCKALRDALDDSGKIDEVSKQFPERPPPGRDPLRCAPRTQKASAEAIAKALVQKASAKLLEAPRNNRADPEIAWQKLVEIDRSGARHNPKYAREWRSACEREPDRILDLIEFAGRKLESKDNPWAYLATMARSKDWGMLRTG